MTEALTLEERGRTITFTFDDMMRYHGVHSPAGVAMAFKVMQRAFAMLSPTRHLSAVRSPYAPRFVALARVTGSRP